MHSTTKDATPHRVSRRSLTRGAAWAAPTVLAAMAAPAIAASSECSPVTAATAQTTLAFTGRTLGQWTQTSSTNPAGRTAPPAEPGSANQGNWVYWDQTNTAAVVKDPPPNVASTTTLTSPSVCLAPGTYSVTFNAKVYYTNARELTLQATVLNADTSASLGTAPIMRSKESTNANRSRTFNFTISERTRVRMRYTWLFASQSGAYGDDIGVTGPQITKTA